MSLINFIPTGWSWLDHASIIALIFVAYSLVHLGTLFLEALRKYTSRDYLKPGITFIVSNSCNKVVTRLSHPSYHLVTTIRHHEAIT